MTTARSLLIFGATGDLARRMLLPSLFGLDADGLLPADTRIHVTARSSMDDEAYRALAAAALEEAVDADRLHPEKLKRFLGRLSYVSVDVAQSGGLKPLAGLAQDAKKHGLAICLSTAPSLFDAAVRGLRAAGLTEAGVRMAVEKPLGHDLASSREINDALASAFPEDRIFRIDHYLGKETVQNLLALRFGNRLFEPLWSAQSIDHVQITIAETIGLEGRVSYYDGVGALRDMVQNHLLQLVSLVAMEPPDRLNASSVRDEKVKVLRALRAITDLEAPTHTVIGQYGAGAIGGAAVPGYEAELGRASAAETFVAIKAHIDNWRWKGVPFYLRTGKRMPRRQTEIIIQFKRVPHSIFQGGDAALSANKLVIQLQPEENIRLLMMVKQAGLDRSGIRLREVPLHLGVDNAFAETRRRIAYERLLLDLIEGDPTLFVRRDEVDAQWAWIDQIRAGWSAKNMTPKLYSAGSWGPSAAIALTERDGVSWHE